jgi:hypothetical protein
VADAAFALGQVYQAALVPQQANTAPMVVDRQVGVTPKEELEEDFVFPWEEQEETLPGELAHLWSRAEAGTKRLDLKALLEDLPRWAELPVKPKQNNYRQDNQRQVDKAWKVAQQMLLHSLRLQACLYTLRKQAEDPHGGDAHGAAPEQAEAEDTNQEQLVLHQQLWQYTADCYFKLESERKEASLPGSTQAADEGLFGKEELQQLKNKTIVNKTFPASMFGPQTRGTWSLSNPFRSPGRWTGRWMGKGNKGGFRPGKGIGGKGAMGKGKGWKGTSSVPGQKHPDISFQGGRISSDGNTGQGGLQCAAGVQKSGRLFATSTSIVTGKQSAPGWCRRIASKTPSGLPKRSSKRDGVATAVQGARTAIQKAAEQAGMVEEGGRPSRRPKGDPRRGGTRMALPKVAPVGTGQVGSRSGPGHAGLGGVSSMWSSASCGPLPVQVLGTMVCDKQKGGRWQRKTQIDFRLSHSEQISKAKAFQIGPLATHFSSPTTGNVCSKDRFKKNAYFHLPLAEALRPYVHLKVGDQVFQFNAACFGLSTLPQVWMELMKVFQKRWRQRGIIVFTYLDDILLVGQTESLVKKHISILLTDLENSGMMVNFEKSALQPTQMVKHLGFLIDFKEGVLQVPAEKLKSIRRELGKLVTHFEVTPRRMSAVLGVVRSFLTAIPFLRAFTDHMVQFTRLADKFGWDKKLPIPGILQQQIREVKYLLQNWSGRQLQKKVPIRRLHSDASGVGWAGVDLDTGNCVQEFWRTKAGLHINVKELHAAISVVRSLAKPGEKVFLAVDNTVAFSYLSKSGGRKSHLNAQMRPFLQWCVENKISLQVQQVKSADMVAEKFSRWENDPGDYTLDRGIFLYIQRFFQKHLNPSVDMFASPGNAQLPLFVTRWPHYQAWDCNALEMSLDRVKECFANPPWKIILPWLEKLRRNPHVTCLITVPRWVGAIWWPLLIKLWVPQTPVLQITPKTGLFTNCQGLRMPPTRWPLITLIVSGKCWKADRCRLTVSHHI